MFFVQYPQATGFYNTFEAFYRYLGFLYFHQLFYYVICFAR